MSLPVRLPAARRLDTVRRVTDAAVLLFVPASPVHETGLAPYGVEVRKLANGQFGCLAFSTVDRLTDALGGYQPWVGVRAGELVRYLDEAGVASLYVDSALPDEASRWQPGQLRDLAAREEGQWQRATR